MSEQTPLIERLSFYAAMCVRTQSDGSYAMFEGLEGWYGLSREVINHLVAKTNLAPKMRKIFLKSEGFILVGPSRDDTDHMEMYWRRKRKSEQQEPDCLVTGLTFPANNPVVRAWDKRKSLVDDIENRLKDLKLELEPEKGIEEKTSWVLDEESEENRAIDDHLELERQERLKEEEEVTDKILDQLQEIEELSKENQLLQDQIAWLENASDEEKIAAVREHLKKYNE